MDVVTPSGDPRAAFADAAQTLQEAATQKLPFLPSFEAFPDAKPGPCTAIDGSHAVLLDNGSVWIVAYRAAAVTWPGPRALPVEPIVVATTPQTAHARLADEYASLGGHDAGPVRVARPAGADAFGQALRDAAEHRATLQVILAAKPGDLILIDGALHGLPEPAGSLARRILELAQERSVDVLAVAKRSGLEASGVPLIPALFAAGPDRTWFTQVPGQTGVHVAKLHRRALAAYRIDGDANVLPRLIPLARDAAYLGYPYPLAVAHNTVALTQSAVHDLKMRLAEEVRIRGGSAAARLIVDAHEMLDRNVPG